MKQNTKHNLRICDLDGVYVVLFSVIRKAVLMRKTKAYRRTICTFAIVLVNRIQTGIPGPVEKNDELPASNI